MAIRVVRTVEELRRWRAGLGTRELALVPTMGFLHEGHVQLMHEGRRRVPHERGELALSIYVNPTQFNDPADLANYPRDEAGDLAKAESAGVDVAFVPNSLQHGGEMYFPDASTFVEVAGLDQHLCGATRPGHFRGVCTVVCKLWQLFRPDVALFGEKDFQQLAIVRRMHRDLFLSGEVIGVPTIREADGLALSSRNARLSAGGRAEAVRIPRFLARVRERWDAGERAAASLIAGAEQALAPGEIHYVSVVDAQSLQPIEAFNQGGGKVLVAVAVFFDGVRLIDNVQLG
jgi:pantoate--beta-alanine ligase